MRLETDTIDADTPGFEFLDQAVHCLCLIASVFDAIIVIVQFDVFAGGLDSLLRKLECEEEVFRSNGIVLFESAI